MYEILRNYFFAVQVKILYVIIWYTLLKNTLDYSFTVDLAWTGLFSLQYSLDRHTV